MSTAEKLNLVSVEDYLEGELTSPIKHEYVDGRLYARPDERNLHHVIAGNLIGVLHARLRGRPSRVFNADTKIRIRLPGARSFLLSRRLGDLPRRIHRPTPFKTSRPLSVEVLSRRTRRIDEGEKKDAYLTIPSLAVYVLVEQGTAAVVAFRRTANGFVREVYQGTDAVAAARRDRRRLAAGGRLRNRGFRSRARRRSRKYLTTGAGDERNSFVVLFRPPFLFRTGSSLPQRRLRRRQAGDRHAERAAADVIQPDLVAELDRVRVAAVLAADADLQVRPRRPALLHRRSSSARRRRPGRWWRTGRPAGCPPSSGRCRRR